MVSNQREANEDGSAHPNARPTRTARSAAAPLDAPPIVLAISSALETRIRQIARTRNLSESSWLRLIALWAVDRQAAGDVGTPDTSRGDKPQRQRIYVDQVVRDRIEQAALAVAPAESATWTARRRQQWLAGWLRGWISRALDELDAGRPGPSA